MQRAGFFLRLLTQQKLDVMDILERDHVQIEMLFFQWRWTRDRERRNELFASIKRELTQHTQLEESLFYPACEKIPELKRLIQQSYDEHREFKALLREITDLSLGSEKAESRGSGRTGTSGGAGAARTSPGSSKTLNATLNTTMRVLMREVHEHVTKEENEIFPLARDLMKKSQIDRLTRELRLAKQAREHKAAA